MYVFEIIVISHVWNYCNFTQNLELIHHQICILFLSVFELWHHKPMRWASDVSWSLSEMIRFWTQSVDFHHFGTTSTSWDWPNWGFPCILWRSHGRNGLKFGMLMYRDHLQKSLYHLHNMIVRFGGGGGGSRAAQFSFRPADYLPLHFGLNFRNPSYIYIRACCIIYICSLYNSVHKFTINNPDWCIIGLEIFNWKYWFDNLSCHLVRPSEDWSSESPTLCSPGG